MERRFAFNFIAMLCVAILFISSCNRNEENPRITESKSDIASEQTKYSSDSESTVDENSELTPTEQTSSKNSNSEFSSENNFIPSATPTNNSTYQPTLSPSPTAGNTPTPVITQAYLEKPVTYTNPTFNDSLVAIVQSDKVKKATDLTQNDIDELVRLAVTYAGGFEGLIKEGDTVVLKPNIVTTRDYTLPGWQGVAHGAEVNGNTTDYRFTRAVAKLVREYNKSSGKIYVVEGSSEDTYQAMLKMNYTKTSIPEVDAFYALEKDSGGWKEFTSPLLQKVSFPQGLLHKEYYQNKLIYDADVYISLPTMKNHWDAAITGGVKNIGIGSTPTNIYGNSASSFSRNNMVAHGTMDLHRWIADYFASRPADFVITDALQGLENGPTPCYEISGRAMTLQDNQKNLRIVLAGRDAVAVDTVSANIMNWDHTSVHYLNFLSDMGIGTNDSRKITVTGNRTISEVRTDFAGVIPAAGGSKITDMNPPVIRNLTASFNLQKLEVKYETDKSSVKVEIYANNRLVWKNTTGSLSVSFDVSGLPKGTYEIKVRSYDKYFNSSEIKVNSVKSSEAHIFNNGNYKAPFATNAPIINGIMDDPVWERASWAPIDQLWAGTMPAASDFRGRYKMAWTEDRLYLLAEITDDVFSDVYSDPLNRYYDDDCLEFFIDEDNSGGDHQNNHNAFAYHVSMFGDVVDLNTKGQPRLFNEHINSIVIYDSKSKKYIWELEIKIFSDTYNENSTNNIPVKLEKGKIMGFAVAYCDADGGGVREHFMGSIPIAGSNKNIAWQTADVFGNVELIN